MGDLRPQPGRILVVEDNEDAAHMMQLLLRAQGHQVRVARDGPEALELLGRHRYDLALCDLGLPGMSGTELACEIRRQPTLRELPLVALTGYGQDDDVARTAEAGFAEHLVKPVDLDVLDRVLARLMP